MHALGAGLSKAKTQANKSSSSQAMLTKHVAWPHVTSHRSKRLQWGRGEQGLNRKKRVESKAGGEGSRRAAEAEEGRPA